MTTHDAVPSLCAQRPPTSGPGTQIQHPGEDTSQQANHPVNPSRTKYSSLDISADLFRSLSQLTCLPTRPILPQQSRATQAFSEDKPTSSLLQPHAPAAQPLQVRTAIRDTYNPSHRVRKRRHGFLSRLRTRTGRKTIKRRKAKGRNTLSH